MLQVLLRARQNHVATLVVTGQEAHHHATVGDLDLRCTRASAGAFRARKGKARTHLELPAKEFLELPLGRPRLLIACHRSAIAASSPGELVSNGARARAAGSSEGLEPARKLEPLATSREREVAPYTSSHKHLAYVRRGRPSRRSADRELQENQASHTFHPHLNSAECRDARPPSHHWRVQSFDTVRSSTGLATS